MAFMQLVKHILHDTVGFMWAFRKISFQTYLINVTSLSIDMYVVHHCYMRILSNSIRHLSKPTRTDDQLMNILSDTFPQPIVMRYR